MYTPKTRKGSAKSAAFSKLRTRARKNCEHALVACSQFSLPRVTTGVRWDPYGRLHPISGGGSTVANCEEPTGELVGQERPVLHLGEVEHGDAGQ